MGEKEIRAEFLPENLPEIGHLVGQLGDGRISCEGRKCMEHVQDEMAGCDTSSVKPSLCATTVLLHD
jgi:hypothetical protein